MDELVAFLRERLDEDEATAQDALNDVVPFHTAIQRLYQGGWHSERSAHHIDRHDPTRVLADVEAKRRIVDNPPVAPDAIAEWEDTVKILTEVFADHPDYREEWRP